MSKNRHRENTFEQLARQGFTPAEAAALVRASATLSTWAEHECNGTIQRDKSTDIPYWYNPDSGKRLDRTNDREAGALRTIGRVMARHPHLSYYVQGDPRGCALYILRPGDVPAGEDPGAYYSRGVAVVP